MAEGTDFQMLGLGIDASKAESGAAQFTSATEKVIGATKATQSGLNALKSAFVGGLGIGAGVGAFKLLTDGIQRAKAAVTEFLSSSNALAARYNELGVVLGVVGVRSGQSVKQLDALEAALRKTGISAIQSRQSILSMIQAKLDLAQATKLARVAQDVAVIGQLNSSDALKRLTHGIVSGQTEVLRTIGINVQFKQSYKELAQELHKSVDALTAQERVQARANVVMKQAETITGAYEASMGSAAKQMRSTERYVEDLKVAVGQVFQPVYTDLVFTYADALKAADHWMKEHKQSVLDAGLTLAKWFEALKHVGAQFYNLGEIAVRALIGIEDTLSLIMSPIEALFSMGQRSVFEVWADNWKDLKDNAAGFLAAILRIPERFTQSNYKKQSLDLQMGGPATMSPLAAFGGVGTDRAGPLAGSAGIGAFARTPLGGDMFAPKPAPVAPELEKPIVDEKAIEKAAKLLKDAKEAATDFLAALRPSSDFMQFERGLAKLTERLTEAKVGFKEIARVQAEARTAFDEQAWRGIMEGVGTTITGVKSKLMELGAQAKAFASTDLASLQDVSALKAQDLTSSEREQLDLIERIRTSNRARFTEYLAGLAKAVAARKAIEEQNATLGVRTALIDGGDTKALAAFDKMQQRVTLTAQNRANGMSTFDAMKAANDTVAAEDAAREAAKTTTEWGAALRDVAQLAGGLLSIFTNLPDAIRQSIGAVAQLGGGIGALKVASDIKNKDGASIGLAGAFSGKGGAAGVLGALSGAAGVVGGVVALGEAIDLFGSKARANQRLMAEANQRAIENLRTFSAETNRTGGVADTIAAARESLAKALIPDVLKASFGPNAKMAAGATEADYLSAGQATQFRQQATQQRALAAGASGPLATYYEGAAQALDTAADTIEKGLKAFRDRVLSMVAPVMDEILRAYNDATGNLDANKLADASAAWSKRMADLGALFSLGAISTEEYNAAIERVNITYRKTTDSIVDAARKLAEADRVDASSFATTVEARGLAASGDTAGAAALRLGMQYEDELRAAREKGRDVTRLLIVQEQERARLDNERLNARRGTDADLFAQEVGLNSGSIAGSLAQKAAEIVKATDAAEAGDKARVNAIGIGQLNQMIAEFRTQATNTLAGYASGATTNTVEQAQIAGTLQMGAAITSLSAYLNAGIITLDEYAQGIANVSAASQRAVDEAKKQQNRDRLGFDATTLGMASALAPMNRDLAKAAYDAEGKAAYQDAYDNAVRLKDAGTITADQFSYFTTVLTEQFSPALRDAAFATAEASRIMGQNMSTLNQQWGVFGTSAQGKVDDLAALFGFGGKSADEIRSLFTKVTPGVELSATQLATNANVSTYLNAYGQVQQGAAADSAAAQLAGSGRLDIQTSQSVSSLSEQTALRLYDVQLMQLSVLRAVENNTRTGGAGGAGGVVVNINMTGTPLVAQTPREAARELGDAILPILVEGMGRKVGVEQRVAGVAAI